MHALLLHHVGFTHSAAPLPLLTDLSLSFEEGWTGVLGANGRGKTTLLRLAVGDLIPTSGRVQSPGPGVLCAQPTEEPPPGLEDFALDFEPESLLLRARLGVGDDHPFRWPSLSHGERKRLQVAVALARRSRVLAVDEPTNHLDEAAREAIAETLAAFRGIGLLVSHDRALLDRLCTRCLDLDGPVPVMRTGGASAALLARDQERTATQGERERLAREAGRVQRMVQRRKEAADRSAGRRSRRDLAPGDADGRARIGLAILTGKDACAGRALASARERLARVQADLAAQELTKDHTGSIWLPGARYRGDTLLQAPAARLSLGPRTLEVPALRLGPTDRVAITGPNGAGKSTLIAHLLAHSTLPPAHCTVAPQDLPAEAARDLLAEVRALPTRERGQVLAIVARLGSRAERLLEGGTPSPGEARKVLVALAAVRSAWLVVLDEPTNHLDLTALTAMEEALAAFPGALVLICHDRRFRERLCRVEWRLAGGRVEVVP